MGDISSPPLILTRLISVSYRIWASLVTHPRDRVGFKGERAGLSRMTGYKAVACYAMPESSASLKREIAMQILNSWRIAEEFGGFKGECSPFSLPPAAREAGSPSKALQKTLSMMGECPYLLRMTCIVELCLLRMICEGEFCGCSKVSCSAPSFISNFIFYLVRFILIKFFTRK